MATKEQRQNLHDCKDDLMKALGKDPKDYFVDIGQGGCLIVGSDGIPPFGFARYTPTAFIEAMEFATAVVEAMKK